MQIPPSDPDRLGRYSDLSDDAFDRLDRLCSQFEQDLRAGKSPRIEDLLTGVEQANRPIFFRFLLKIELDPDVNPRWESGQEPNIAEYRQRFPQFIDIIEKVFRELSTESGDSQGDQSSPPSSLAPGPTAPPDMPPGLPKHLEIQEKFDTGGFGRVYRARDLKLERLVAVKVLRPERRWDGLLDTIWKKFVAEARVLAKLEHPNLARIYEFPDLYESPEHVGDPDKFIGWAIVMEYLENGPLYNLRRCWPVGTVNIHHVLEVMEQVADAVHHIHTAFNAGSTLVHQDLKPSNILLDKDNHPHIVDFGLAALVSDIADHLEPVAGTEQYMSPEQLRCISGHSALVDRAFRHLEPGGNYLRDANGAASVQRFRRANRRSSHVLCGP